MPEAVHSRAVEDYLKAIYKLGGDSEPVATSALAEELTRTAASVTNMIKGLADRGLLEHTPYYGARLTETGRSAALRIIRRHRILETYLIERLGFGWDTVHEEAERHLLIAGGIGITPMLAMVRRLAALGADYTLHYCTRNAEKTAFREELMGEPFASHVRFHHDGGDPSKGLDVDTLLAEVEEGTHVYCCGPIGLMHAVTDASDHWPVGTVHFEFFATGAAVRAAP